MYMFMLCKALKLQQPKLAAVWLGNFFMLPLDTKKAREHGVANYKKRWIYREDTEVVSLVIPQQYKSIIC